MYSNFKAQGLEYGKEAAEADVCGDYSKAFPLYMNALEYLKTQLKYEKDPNEEEFISQKFTLYLRRAEEIRALLDHAAAAPPLTSVAPAGSATAKLPALPEAAVLLPHNFFPHFSPG